PDEERLAVLSHLSDEGEKRKVVEGVPRAVLRGAGRSGADAVVGVRHAAGCLDPKGHTLVELDLGVEPGAVRLVLRKHIELDLLGTAALEGDLDEIRDVDLEIAVAAS